MLTDDDLTQQLGAAFHATSDDLTYTGMVPTASRTPSTRWLTVPAVAAAAALVVIPSAGDGDGSRPDQAGPSAAPDAAPELVTETIRVAGYTLTYEREARGSAPVAVMLGELTLPEDFREVELEGSVRAWAGFDATSGDAIVYVQPPANEGGGLFALASPTWTQEQLVELLREGISGT